MDAIGTIGVIVIALLMLGAAASVFGKDSRESGDDVRLPASPRI